LLVGLIGSQWTAAFAAAPTRPNILFIFGDDCGIDSFGCYGSDRSKTFTPNIDSLARSGIIASPSM